MNPMKFTAIALLLLGAVITVFAVVSLMPGSDSSATIARPPDASGPSAPSAWLLFPFAALSLAAGLGILFFGDRGVIRTRNPAIRN